MHCSAWSSRKPSWCAPATSRGAAKLEASKAELSRLYFLDAARLKASQAFLKQAMPDIFAALRQRHDLFHALLQMNLTVLATAHAVSESIMRGVSDELARRATPQRLRRVGARRRAAAVEPATARDQPGALTAVSNLSYKLGIGT